MVKQDVNSYYAKVARALDEAWEEEIAEWPHEVLNLPPLLAKKREQYQLIHDLWDYAATWSYCFVVQLKAHHGEGKTYVDGGAIVMPDKHADHLQHSNARGVLISAGPQALDQLNSVGIDIGHTVLTSRMSAYYTHAGSLHTEPKGYITVLAGEIRGSLESAMYQRLGLHKFEIEEFQREGYTVQERVLREYDPDGSLQRTWTPMAADKGTY